MLGSKLIHVSKSGSSSVMGLGTDDWFKGGLIFFSLLKCLACNQPHDGRNGHQIEGDWEEHRHRWNETKKHI